MILIEIRSIASCDELRVILSHYTILCLMEMMCNLHFEPNPGQKPWGPYGYEDQRISIGTLE